LADKQEAIMEDYASYQPPQFSSPAPKSSPPRVLSHKPTHSLPQKQPNAFSSSFQAVVKVTIRSTAQLLINAEPGLDPQLQLFTPYTSDSNQTFTIPRALLCSTSLFFAHAFAHPSIQSITLEGIDAPLFSLFIHYLHHQKFTYESSKEPLDLTDLGRLWVLGNRFQMPSFQNLVMNALHDRVTNVFPEEFIDFANLAYAISGGENVMARLAVGLLVSASWMFFEVVIPLVPGRMHLDVGMEVKRSMGRAAVKVQLESAEKFYVDAGE
jgi:hypothetical protein